MNKTTYTTTRFDIDKGFYVEVSPNINFDGENMYDFVLCLEGYGIKEFMFGLLAEDCIEESWEEIIKNNIDAYIEIFISNMKYWDNQPIN